MIQDKHTVLENYRANSKLMSKIKCKNVDYIVIGHLHCDHIANIPTLFARGNCNVRIIVPKGSIAIMKEMLLDCAYINQRDCDSLNLKSSNNCYTPLYTEKEVFEAISHVEEYDINSIIQLDDTFSIRYTPSGHILSACQTELFISGNSHTKKILFTSDLGNTLIEDRKIFVEHFRPVHTCNIMFGECTYGLDTRQTSKKDIVLDREKIKSVVDQYCIDGHHRVLIPTFSLDRMPFMLWELYQIWGNDKNFNIPIIVDSPLSNRLLDCYSSVLQDDRKEKFDELMSWKNIKRVITPEDSKAAIADKGAKVILASSGMLTAGRSVKWVQNILPNQNDCILFIGFAGEDTLAGRIKHSSEKRTISINGKQISNKCNIIDLHSFSSHMQRNDLLKYYKGINCEKIYLVHSDKEARLSFKTDLEKELEKICKTTKVVAVNNGMKISL